MTKEELKVLKDWMPELELMARYNDNSIDYQRYSALDMAIKALEQQSTLDTRQRERQLEMEYQHGYDKGWEEGRKALEQQPCEDCISREEAVNELKLAYFNKNLQSAKDDPCIVDAMTDWAIRIIKRLPSVTSSIPDVENNFNLGYNCGYADAMSDIAESEEEG